MKAIKKTTFPPQFHKLCLMKFLLKNKELADCNVRLPNVISPSQLSGSIEIHRRGEFKSHSSYSQPMWEQKHGYIQNSHGSMELNEDHPVTIQ